ncbi:MAG: ATP-binding protein [Dehalococcoidia bacterium]|nr:ATP-binding protein [Dehalococcoidia bacterium]
MDGIKDGIEIVSADLPRCVHHWVLAEPARSDGRHVGLGLATVAELVQAHGGSVQARSSPETGTVITVRLLRAGPEGYAVEAGQTRK